MAYSGINFIKIFTTPKTVRPTAMYFITLSICMSDHNTFNQNILKYFLDDRRIGQYVGTWWRWVNTGVEICVENKVRYCELFEFRLGNNPYHTQNLTAEQREDRSERLRTRLIHD